MKKYYSYTKYQELKLKIDSLGERIPKLDKDIDRIKRLLKKRLNKKEELIINLQMAKNKIAKIREDYTIPIKNPESGRVTSTPLPKRWRKKE